MDKKRYPVRSTEFWRKKPSSNCTVFKQNNNGTIVYIIPQKSQYILTLKTENGNFVSEDIYGILKYYNPKVRITKIFRERYENFMSTREYYIEDNNFIRGLYESTEEFFLNYRT